MTQFVWLYKHDHNHPDDLFLSMLSVHRYFDGEARYAVVGDRPEWLSPDVTHVESNATLWPAVRRQAITINRVRYVDTMRKMEKWCQRDSEDDQFIWMMDDQVFIRPFSAEFFATRLWQDNIKTVIKPWEKLVTATMRRFIEAKHYSTHFPQLFSRARMLEVYEYLNMPEVLFLFDCAYGNFWKGPDAYYQGIARRITKSLPKSDLSLAFFEECEETVLNWDDRAFDYPAFRQFLKDRICSGHTQFAQLPFASNIQISSL